MPPRFLLLCSTIILCCVITVLTLEHGLCQRRLPTLERDKWFTSDTVLQQNCEIEVRNLPLKTILANLGQQHKLDIKASSLLGQIPLTISSRGTVSEFMQHIEDLFRHGSHQRFGATWQRIQDKNEKPFYLLSHTRSGLEEEKEHLTLPKTILKRWIYAIREYLNTPEEKREGFLTDCPMINYYAQRKTKLDSENALGTVVNALTNITEGEIETLLTTRVIELSQTDSGAEQPTKLKLSLLGDRYETRAFFITVSDPRSPRNVDSIPLDVFGVQGHTIWHQAEIEKMQKEEQGSEIDLFRGIKPPAGLPSMDLNTAIGLWQKASGKSVYGEIFRTDKTPIAITKDKPETLLARLCYAFGYDWRKIGDHYFIYSKVWAIERNQHISDEQLRAWKKHIEDTPEVPIHVIIEVSKLNDDQIHVASKQLRIQSVFNTLERRLLWRIIASLPSRQRKELFERSVKTTMGVTNTRPHLQRLFGTAELSPNVTISCRKWVKNEITNYDVIVTNGSLVKQGWLSLGKDPVINLRQKNAPNDRD